MAKQNRRFYWLQLRENFFTTKEMKLLRKMAGGDTYTIIYLKMMLASLEDAGVLYFDYVGDDIYEEIALLIDESVEDVKMTFLFLQNKKLLTIKSDYEYKLEQVPELIGSETASARRVRKHREGQKALQCNTDETKRNGDIEKEIDINIDIEKQLDIDTEKAAAEKSKKNIYDYYQSRIGVLDGYQAEKLKGYLDIDSLEPDLVKRAIDRAADNSKRNFGYVNAILKNWTQNGIKTIAQQDEEQRSFGKQADKSEPNPAGNIPEWSRMHPNYKPPERKILTEEEFLALDDEE